MMNSQQYGLFLFQKSKSATTALKEMLQFLRSHAPGKNLQFAYVEGETSLIPHLSLWENLHVVSGGNNWKEFQASLNSECLPLTNMISNPHILASQASSWEKLTVSLLKGILINSPHILVDMNEDLHAPLNLMNLKKILALIADKKNVYLATSNTSLWLDSCHSIISREGYAFKVEILDQHRLVPVKAA